MSYGKSIYMKYLPRTPYPDKMCGIDQVKDSNGVFHKGKKNASKREKCKMKMMMCEKETYIHSNIHIHFLLVLATQK